MMLSHTLTQVYHADMFEQKVGELVVSFVSKGIYTKSLTSNTLRVGNSVRNLTEFDIYDSGVGSINSTSAAVLLFKRGRLTTTYPFFQISELGSTLINNSTLGTANYIGVTIKNQNTSILVNQLPPAFRFVDLGDVQSLTLSADTHGYSPAIQANTVNSTKDPFISKYEYTWTLRPESSRLLKHDDTRENIPKQSYQVLRAYTSTEQRGVGVENTVLPIVYDRFPKLADNLNCNGFCVFNQRYFTQFVFSNTNLFTVSCDVDVYDMFIINCQDTNVLQISFVHNGDNLAAVALIISNFEGAIQFLGDVEFENGHPPVLSGKEHIINCLVYNTKVRVLQKSTNLSKVI